MKTWRERIADARKRKRGLLRRKRGFDQSDHYAALNIYTCACREALDAVGLTRASLYDLGKWRDLELFEAFPRAVYKDRIDEAERILDAAEDRALTLKRERQP